MQIQYSSPEEAFSLLADAQVIVTAMAASEPQIFFQSAQSQLPRLNDAIIYYANPSKAYSVFADESLLGHVDFRPMFLTSSVRNHRNRPHVHYVPQHLSQWVAHIQQRGVDVFWGSCSLPDERGLVSLGPSNCYEWEILHAAKHIILEVNQNIPFTFGSTIFPFSQATVLLESTHPLATGPLGTFDEIDETIANYVGELITDGDTIQLGIGSIPNALCKVLASKKDLGVHAELINDTIAKLAQSGVITGRKKTLWPDKIIGAFAFGSQDLYRFIDHNPLVEFHPASIVNDAYQIGRNHRMVSINAAIEVDISGQVCSESIGHVELTGIGGASETHIGAQRSKGGRGIVVLRSTAKSLESKIVAELRPGAKVSISRNDIDSVVTEFGIAILKGKTVAERARNLIQIAHPDHRDELCNKAQKFGYF